MTYSKSFVIAYHHDGFKIYPCIIFSMSQVWNYSYLTKHELQWYKYLKVVFVVELSWYSQDKDWSKYTKPNCAAGIYGVVFKK